MAATPGRARRQLTPYLCCMIEKLTMLIVALTALVAVLKALGYSTLRTPRTSNYERKSKHRHD